MMSAVMIGLAAGAVIPATASVRGSALGHDEFVSGNARAINYYRLVQYPGAGFGGLYAQIAHARRTIDMEMYELADQTAESELAVAAARGVRVRVLLDRDFSGAKVNRSAVSYLAARRVDVGWAPAGYIFHIKTTTFDANTADISTANLVSKYYRGTRDAEIIDSNPAQVRAIERTFSNDWIAGSAGSPKSQTVQAPGLVWSPGTESGTAETAFVNQIRSAGETIDFESEELSDPAIYGALAADASNGVRCRVVMTRSSEWNDAFRALAKAGCRIHLFPDSPKALYIHEKLILDDAGNGQPVAAGRLPKREPHLADQEPRARDPDKRRPRRQQRDRDGERNVRL